MFTVLSISKMSKPELTELFKLITYLDKDWYPNKDDTLILKDIAKWRLCFMKSSLSNKSPFLLDIEKFINTNILLARQIVFYYINTKLYKIYKHTTPESKVYIGITGQQFAEQRWNDGSGYRPMSILRLARLFNAMLTSTKDWMPIC